MSDAPLPLPAFTSWPTFPFEGDLRVKRLADPVDEEPPRHGEDPSECSACRAPDSAYIWISERWRVRSLDRPTGLPMVLILESRSHLDMGDLTNLLAAELGVLTVRLERAIRSLDGVARVHVNRWGDGSAHLHVWFLARPAGRLQLRGTFLSLWDDILPRIPETQWRENLALVAAWLADFGGEALAEPPHIDWQSPALLNIPNGAEVDDSEPAFAVDDAEDPVETGGMGSSVVAAETGELTRELHVPAPVGRDGVTTVAIPRGTTGGTVSRGTGQPARETDDVVSRGTDRTMNLADVGGGETVRIPTARTAGGETVNLADVASGSTVRFTTGAGASAGNGGAGAPGAPGANGEPGAAGANGEPGADDTGTSTGGVAGPATGSATRADAHAGTTDPHAGQTGPQAASQGAPEGSRSAAQSGPGNAPADQSPTMRFGTSGVSGNGTQTMVFPTGDAMAAAQSKARTQAEAQAQARTEAGAQSKTKTEAEAQAEA
ncbi:hypothetical protein GCM10009557_57660 [Virgisporangium ochraceum]|uniref:Uncharacterized protein n=1 Tax=Virgisporangium ochraceum TaxID=65505 RepID=A0A8J3ZNK8_9ACTN|nr:hypothetical protein Voc01_011190 [Virgisporangium ochraceum]